MTPVEQALQRLRTTKHASVSDARRLLTTESTAAIALLAATKQLLGDHETWEPETLWLELARRDHGNFRANSGRARKRHRGYILRTHQ